MTLTDRKILLNPGPATTTDSVKLAQIVPDICPREKEFTGIMRQLQSDLLRIVHGSPKKYTAVLFCGSGTINIDVCLNSLLPQNRTILIVNNGAYSSRAVEICQYYNLPHINLTFPYNQLPDLQIIAKTLNEHPEITVVYTTHNETGTGILNPIKQIGELAHNHNAQFIVDTTSTLAMLPIDIEENNIDFCMASSQKGLMAMTGLSFIIGRIDEIEKSKNYPKRSYYCNLYLQYDYFKRFGQMHFTPPVQTIYAAVQAMKEYFAEGEEQKWQRHKRVDEKLYRGIKELGFQEVIKREWQSGLVISILYPDDKNWDFNQIHDYCYSRGFTIYPGKILQENTFRLCSLGAIDIGDIDCFLQVLKDALLDSRVAIPVIYRRPK